MSKERVVVFDGEDKFIAPRDKSFDKQTGNAQFVGDKQSPPAEAVNPDKKAFEDYMLKKGSPVVMPSPVEPNFCVKMQDFIKTSGNGMATPEQIMEAYQLFQDKCVEKPKDKEPISANPEEPVVTEKVKEVEVPPASAPAPIAPSSFIPLSVPTLGARPSSGGSEEVVKEEPKQEINWLLWLIVGGGILYLITRKND